MARAVWKGTISASLLSIPVKLYNATEDKTIQFHRIHGECGSRIQIPWWCPTCERKIDRRETKRAYEIVPGEQVILEDADFEKIPLKSLKEIEITEAVKAEKIDPLVYHTPMYVAPEEGGAKPYALLFWGLNSLNLVAIAKLTWREGKEQLVAIRPHQAKGVLLLQTLRYQDEIRSAEDFKLPRVDISQDERELAALFLSLLEKEEFDYGKYQDNYREALENLIQEKIAGKAIAAVSAPETTPETDLIKTLKASIEALKRAKETPPIAQAISAVEQAEKILEETRSEKPSAEEKPQRKRRMKES